MLIPTFEGDKPQQEEEVEGKTKKRGLRLKPRGDPPSARADLAQRAKSYEQLPKKAKDG